MSVALSESEDLSPDFWGADEVTGKIHSGALPPLDQWSYAAALRERNWQAAGEVFHEVFGMDGGEAKDGVRYNKFVSNVRECARSRSPFALIVEPTARADFRYDFEACFRMAANFARHPIRDRRVLPIVIVDPDWAHTQWSDVRNKAQPTFIDGPDAVVTRAMEIGAKVILTRSSTYQEDLRVGLREIFSQCRREASALVRDTMVRAG